MLLCSVWKMSKSLGLQVRIQYGSDKEKQATSKCVSGSRCWWTEPRCDESVQGPKWGEAVGLSWLQARAAGRGCVGPTFRRTYMYSA
jgi:hypothetical protein